MPDATPSLEALARQGAVHAPGGDLSPLEVRCLVCASHGLGRSETGVLLHYAPDTVKAAVRRARRELAAKNTAHAVAIALRLGIIT